MPKPETNRRRIVACLEAEGWISIGGGDHENFVKPGQRMIQVPRHREVSTGVAWSIARAAGWQ